MVTEASDEHPQKAPCSIAVTPTGMVTEASDEHP